MKKRGLNVQDVVDKLIIYDLLRNFSSKKEILKWISKLNRKQIRNFLSLNIDRKKIKFNTKLLIDENLLNTEDYLSRVNAIVSIGNAEGYYYLFDKLVSPEFLKSEKFYKDIETLKRASCARIPLEIIAKPDFINSPYHDEDFQLIVTIKDKKIGDYTIQEALAAIAGNRASIKSDYHLEDMKILAENQEIGEFLYAVMTNSRLLKSNNYRKIIMKMIEHKDDKKYLSLVCSYAGETAILDEIQYFGIAENHFLLFEEDRKDILKLIRDIAKNSDNEGKKIKGLTKE